MKTIGNRLRKFYNRGMSFLYNLISKKSSIQIESLFVDQKMKEYWHPIVAIRYMYIESYYNQDCTGKNLYNKSSSNKLSKCEIDEDNKRFDSLIYSFEKNGLIGDSMITMDRDGVIFDGTHRIALCIWFGIKCIDVRVIPRKVRKISATTVINSFGLNQNEIKELESAYKRMRNKCYDT